MERGLLQATKLRDLSLLLAMSLRIMERQPSKEFPLKIKEKLLLQYRPQIFLLLRLMSQQSNFHKAQGPLLRQLRDQIMPAQLRALFLLHRDRVAPLISHPLAQLIPPEMLHKLHAQFHLVGNNFLGEEYAIYV